MFKQDFNKSGVALFVVLGTLLILIILANVVLSIISSQSRLTHHQVSRIQASYAAQAGMNYALEQLRTNVWTATNCSETNPCNLTDTQFPASIQNVRIILRSACAPGPGCLCPSPPAAANSTCVETTANYTSSTQ